MTHKSNSIPKLNIKSHLETSQIHKQQKRYVFVKLQFYVLRQHLNFAAILFFFFRKTNETLHYITKRNIHCEDEVKMEIGRKRCKLLFMSVMEKEDNKGRSE